MAAGLTHCLCAVWAFTMILGPVLTQSPEVKQLEISNKTTAFRCPIGRPHTRHWNAVPCNKVKEKAIQAGLAKGASFMSMSSRIIGGALYGVVHAQFESARSGFDSCRCYSILMLRRYWVNNQTTWEPQEGQLCCYSECPKWMLRCNPVPHTRQRPQQRRQQQQLSDSSPTQRQGLRRQQRD